MCQNSGFDATRYNWKRDERDATSARNNWKRDEWGAKSEDYLSELPFMYFFNSGPECISTVDNPPRYINDPIGGAARLGEKETATPRIKIAALTAICNYIPNRSIRLISNVEKNIFSTTRPLGFRLFRRGIWVTLTKERDRRNGAIKDDVSHAFL